MCRQISGFTILCFLIQAEGAAQVSAVDSLKSALENVQNDSTRIEILTDLSYELVFQDPDTAILISKEALMLSEKIDDTREIAGSCLDIGIAYWVKAEYDQAIHYYKRAESISEKAGHTEKMIGAWVNLGIAYRAKGDYPRSLSYYLRSVSFVEEMEDKSRLSGLCTNIGVLYRSMGEYDNAMAYYSRAKKINEEVGNDRELVRCLHNIAHVHALMHRQREAIEMYLESIALSKDIGYTVAQATSLFNLGTVYTSTGEYTEALKSLRAAHQIYKELGARDGEAGVLLALCDAYLSLPEDTIQSRFDSLLNYSLMAEQISEKNGNRERLYLSRKMLSRLYKWSGDFKRSLDYYKQYAIVKDSMFNEDKSKEIGKLEARHEFETAEAEQKRTEAEFARREAMAKTRRDNLQYSGILIFIVLIFASVFVLGRFSIPIRLAEGMIFFSFLLFFEFTLVLLDPYIEQYSSGAPAVKLGFNAMLAAMIFPLHSLFENKLKGSFIAGAGNQ
ncbi:MAG: tetratricopeptide repeat protein [Flavobacteriales bacterium]|nr:tetratricopeptide repeat protein [Flavobacteriales bacterium]